jgi:hypothetical protein
MYEASRESRNYLLRPGHPALATLCPPPLRLAVQRPMAFSKISESATARQDRGAPGGRRRSRCPWLPVLPRDAIGCSADREQSPCRDAFSGYAAPDARGRRPRRAPLPPRGRCPLQHSYESGRRPRKETKMTRRTSSLTLLAATLILLGWTAPNLAQAAPAAAAQASAQALTATPPARRPGSPPWRRSPSCARRRRPARRPAPCWRRTR